MTCLNFFVSQTGFRSRFPPLNALGECPLPFTVRHSSSRCSLTAQALYAVTFKGEGLHVCIPSFLVFRTNCFLVRNRLPSPPSLPRPASSTSSCPRCVSPLSNHPSPNHSIIIGSFPSNYLQFLLFFLRPQKIDWFWTRTFLPRLFFFGQEMSLWKGCFYEILIFHFIFCFFKIILNRSLTTHDSSMEGFCCHNAWRQYLCEGSLDKFWYTIGKEKSFGKKPQSKKLNHLNVWPYMCRVCRTALDKGGGWNCGGSNVNPTDCLLPPLRASPSSRDCSWGCSSTREQPGVPTHSPLSQSPPMIWSIYKVSLK